MIQSMTGFGAATAALANHALAVEIRTLNAKFFDLTLRLPRALHPYEGDLRDLLTKQLGRGKVVLTAELRPNTDAPPTAQVNLPLVRAYYAALRDAALACQAPTEGLFLRALDLPEATLAAEETAPPWEAVRPVVAEAAERCDRFRRDEGAALLHEFRQNVSHLRTRLDQIEARDPARLEALRSRLRGRVAELIENPDENRLEQEIIFYAEKLDIREEQVRLRAHLDYFVEVLEAPQSSGKKLNFIAQEMGREINTIGSKANDAPIQRCVVEMKEELDKIKEQVLNVV